MRDSLSCRSCGRELGTNHVVCAECHDYKNDQGPATLGPLCIKEAMVLAGVSRRTIYNWLAAGRVQYTRTAGGAVRIFPDTLFRPTQKQDW